MILDFWRGKRVFLTGHTGFKGSWMSLWLQKLGAEVTGYSLGLPTDTSMFDVADVAKGMASILGDIRDLSTLKQAIQSARPDIVIHMAAQSLVRMSYSSPIETYSTNVMGTANVLESIRYTPEVKAAVVVTTDKCYENKEWVWGYRENEPMGGYDPYSSSKGCAELVSAAYRSSFFNKKDYKKHGVSVATVRAGNVIGGGDWARDRLIPDILKAFERKKLASLRNPKSTRPWQHVLEPIRGYLMLAEKLYTDGQSYAEGWNFGPIDSDAKAASWIADQLSIFWGGGANWVSSSIDQQEHEANYLKLDSSKANSKLGWRQSTELKGTLRDIVRWHRAFIDRADMRDETLSQIHDYEKNLY